MRFVPSVFLVSLIAACSSSSSGPAANGSPAVSAMLTSPAVPTFHTNGKISIQAVVTGAPDRVQLTKNGKPLADLVPPYTYLWDTTAEAEASYELRAVAFAGGAQAVSDPRTVVVDRTPPSVLSRIPAPAASKVDVHDPVRVTFSEAIAPATLTDASLTLMDGQAHVLTRTLDVDPAGASVTVHVASQIAAPATITAKLTNAITDLAGNALTVPPDEWRFTLPEWLAVGSPLGKDEAHAMILDKAGHPVVVWQERVGGGYLEHFSAWDGSKWNDLGSGPLDATPRGFSDLPRLLLDPNGELDVGWTDSQFYNRLAQRSGLTWISLAEQSPWKSLGAPNAIVWFDFDAGGHPLASHGGTKYRWDGNAWQPFPAEPTTAYPKFFAVDATGAAILAMTNSYANGTSLQMYTSTGAGWIPMGSNIAMADDNIAFAGNSQSSLRIVGSNGRFSGTAGVWLWTGSAWDNVPGVGGSVPDLSDGGTPVLGADGALFVIGNASGSNETLVRKWDGTSWSSFGKTPFFGARSLAVDANGMPFVAGNQQDSSLQVIRRNQ